MTSISTDIIQAGMGVILKGMAHKYGLDTTDINFKDTPARVSRMYDEIFSGIQDTDRQIQDILNSSFPSDYDQMILLRDVEVFSMCPHHFLPVHYHISVAYVPSEKGYVLGLSKLARLVEVLAKRPVLQEQLTKDIAEHLIKAEFQIRRSQNNKKFVYNR